MVQSRTGLVASLFEGKIDENRSNQVKTNATALIYSG